MKTDSPTPDPTAPEILPDETPVPDTSDDFDNSFETFGNEADGNEAKPESEFTKVEEDGETEEIDKPEEEKPEDETITEKKVKTEDETPAEDETAKPADKDKATLTLVDKIKAKAQAIKDRFTPDEPEVKPDAPKQTEAEKAETYRKFLKDFDGEGKQDLITADQLAAFMKEEGLEDKTMTDDRGDEVKMSDVIKDDPQIMQIALTLSRAQTAKDIQARIDSGEFASKAQMDAIQEKLELNDYYDGMNDLEHSDARKIQSSAEYETWLNDQEEDVKSVALTLDPEGGAAVMDMYKAELALKAKDAKDDKARIAKEANDDLHGNTLRGGKGKENVTKKVKKKDSEVEVSEEFDDAFEKHAKESQTG